MILLKLKSDMFFLLISLLLISFTTKSSANYSFTSNGKKYEIIETKYSWVDAAKYASDKGGYLVHIDSKEEQDAIYDAIVNGAKISSTYVSVWDGGGAAYIWIGANDRQNEGTWVWDGDGVNFWNGQGDGGQGDGVVVDNKYNNWGGTKSHAFPYEPDDYYDQDAAGIALSSWPLGIPGEWNDIEENNQLYFIVEYDYSDIPGKPNKPVGTEILCQNASNTEYKTNAVANAITYIWDISPATAGIVIGTGAKVNVDWNKDFYGTAELTVAAKNPLGTSNTSDKLLITVKSRTEKCDTPTGPEILCENPENSIYKIKGISGVTNYVWQIMPINAGVITGSSLEGVVDWNDSFSGTAKISVAGSNDCGQGESSSELIVKISQIPIQPLKPTGKEKVVQNSQNTVYTILSSENSKTYKWNLVPSEAGVILGDSLSATVDWSELFAGQAEVSVSGVNTCGESLVSASLIITVSDKPAKADKPTGEISICQGTADSKYSTKVAEGAVGYKWKIEPKTAGSILGDADTVIIVWNKEFSGKAEISVASVGQLKLGDESDKLSVEINPKPTKCSTPQGLIKSCKGAKKCEYETDLNGTVKSYVWVIKPKEAGVVNGNSNKITIDWNNEFIGKASISVLGVNLCGGTVSDSLVVELITIPVNPTKPTGKTSLNKNAENTEYQITPSEFADSYIWKIEPTNAGTIAGNTIKGIVDWNKDFKGDAKISVKALNTCGESAYSENLQVVISDTAQTSINDLSIRDDSIILYPNPVSDNINIEFNDINLDLINMKIFNVFGSQIKSIPIMNGINHVNIEQLPAGKYYCIFNFGLKTITKSFEVIK